MLSLLDTVMHGGTLAAADLAALLKSGHVAYTRGRAELTPYGVAVWDTLMSR